MIELVEPSERRTNLFGILYSTDVGASHGEDVGHPVLRSLLTPTRYIEVLAERELVVQVAQEGVRVPRDAGEVAVVEHVRLVGVLVRDTRENRAVLLRPVKVRRAEDDQRFRNNVVDR